MKMITLLAQKIVTKLLRLISIVRPVFGSPILKEKFYLLDAPLLKDLALIVGGSAAAGTVEKDESYEDNILKEAREELGLIDIIPIPVKKILMSGYHPHFTQWFLCVIDKEIGEFTLQKEEVAEIRWFTPDEIVRFLKEQPEIFVSNIFDWIKLFLPL